MDDLTLIMRKVKAGDTTAVNALWERHQISSASRWLKSTPKK